MSRILSDKLNFKDEVFRGIASHVKEGERTIEEETLQPQQNLVLDLETVKQLADMVTQRMIDIIDHNKIVHNLQHTELRAKQLHEPASQAPKRS